MINGVGKGPDGRYVDRKTETGAQTIRTEEWAVWRPGVDGVLRINLEACIDLERKGRLE